MAQRLHATLTRSRKPAASCVIGYSKYGLGHHARYIAVRPSDWPYGGS
jgi:hypothetical protein